MKGETVLSIMGIAAMIIILIASINFINTLPIQEDIRKLLFFVIPLIFATIVIILIRI